MIWRQRPETAPAVEAPFYIPATNLPARPVATLKHGDSFVIFDSHGDIGASSGAQSGLFHCDTRFLSHLELLVNSAQPLLLGSALKDDNLSYYADLTNPDLYEDDRIALFRDTLHLGRTMYLHDASLRQHIRVANYGSRTVSFDLSITFSCDFADIFELRGVGRERRGKTWRLFDSDDMGSIVYEGLDGTPRRTVLHFEPAPTILLDSIARYRLTLEPDAAQILFVSASAMSPPFRAGKYAFFKGMASLERERRRRQRRMATVETSNPALNLTLNRSAADLNMLLTATPDGFYPYAGIPWYSTSFGRDGVITALEVLWLDPSVAAGVLRRLARFQATGHDPAADSSPGKILHEMRRGEMAALREVPFELYYGSVDSTPLFVLLAGAYAERTGDYDLIRELWPAVEKALAWIDGDGDPDGDGFIEYERRAATGLSNQGWKDSFDSVFHADGRLAEGPIALAEAQSYVYAAKLKAAGCARALGLDQRARELDEAAERLRERFEAAFWCERIGMYALALDGAKRPCEVRASNAGQVLFSGIASAGRAAYVARQLRLPDFASGWGVRTVAEGEARYNPMSYHNGSVWPHDNALIAAGLARYGHKSADIFEALMQAACCMDNGRLPELFCGFRRRRGRRPTLYPSACSPQAWAAGAPFHLLQTLLGVEFDATAGEIWLTEPLLPESVGDVTVRNLPLGGGSADFVVRQSGGRTIVDLLKVTGGVSVAIQSP